MTPQDDAALDAAGLPDFLRDPLGLIRRRWLWMLVAAGVSFLLMASVVLLLVKPGFLATATVLVNSQEIPEEFVQSTVEEDSFEQINALVGSILARDRLADLVERHDLYPELRGQVEFAELLAAFRGSVTIEEQQGIGRQARNVTSKLFTVSFKAGDPETAALVANDLADALTGESIRIRQEKAALTTQFLRLQMEEIEGELRLQESRVTEFKQAYRGELPSELESNLRKLERLQAQRQSLALQIAEAETRLATLAGDQLPAGSPESRLMDLRQRHAEELAVHTEEHPNVVSLKRQLEAVEAAIANGSASGFSLAASTDRTIRELRVQLATTEAEIGALDARVGLTPARQEELAALEQKTDVLRSNYLEFLHKVQEAELAESLESAQKGEHVSVLDRATVPTAPERSRLKFLALVLVLALGIGAGAGLLLEITDPVVFGTRQLESRYDFPVLGSVPRIS
jgi:uncharacterized protein involved in exopolysaccharide biosynthesis